MKTRPSQYLVLLAIILFTRAVIAQNYNELPDTIKSQIRTKTHILINLETVSNKVILTLLEKRTPLAVYLSSNSATNESFIKQYEQYYKDLIIIDSEANNMLSSPNLRIIHVTSKEIDQITLPPSLETKSYFKYDGTKELGQIRFNNAAVLTDSLLFHLWKISGKQPTFIEANEESITKLDSIVSKLNRQKRIFGIVTTDKSLVQNVSFKNLNDVVINGNFSYPLLKGEERLVLMPYKKGYYFSPDVISTTSENINIKKIFSAIPLEPEFGLTDHFIFKNKLENKIRKNNEQFILNNVEIKKDHEKDNVGYFNNGAYVDTGIDSKNSLQKNFTIAIWVKPNVHETNNSILGKGPNFVLKLHEGFLTFTMADIKDYVSKASYVTLNEWSHIALVHSEIDQELLFYINGQETEQIKLISEYKSSDHNLLIGSNLWEQYFIGYLDDLKIYNRALNTSEINSLFEKQENSTLSYRQIIAGSILFVIFILIFLVIKKRSVQSKSSGFTKVNPINSISVKSSPREEILCFGNLKIINKRGINIAEKLSPTHKKIFIIVFLYSELGAKKGISTKKLTEFIWSGMSPKDAKNTRGTTVNNLRLILDSCLGIQLIFKNKHWFLELSAECFCDFQSIQEYLDEFSAKVYPVSMLEKELPGFLGLLSNGRLFSNSSDSWLDPFIEKFSNRIIDQCLILIKKLDFDIHGDLILRLADSICTYDDLNEQAISLKLQLLIHQGKLSLAHTVYDSFVKLYHDIYKENYPYDFETVLTQHNF